MDQTARARELTHEVAEARRHLAQVLEELEEATRPRRVAGRAAASLTARAAAALQPVTARVEKWLANRDPKETAFVIVACFGATVMCVAVLVRRQTRSV